MDSRRDERLESISESRYEALRLGGLGCTMMSSRMCTGEEIDLESDLESEDLPGAVRQRWIRMRKGRERARKGEEMAGWDEDESSWELRDDKRPRRRRRVRDHLTMT